MLAAAADVRQALAAAWDRDGYWFFRDVLDKKVISAPVIREPILGGSGQISGNFTVEDIADAAGISRRTFFNYFSSTEAAIAAVTFGFLDKALQQFRLRPAGEPFLESARAALSYIRSNAKKLEINDDFFAQLQRFSKGFLRFLRTLQGY